MMKMVKTIGVLLAVAVGLMSCLSGPVLAAEATVLNSANRAAHTQAIPIFTNASSIAAGTEYDIGFLASEHTWMLDFTGSPTSVSVKLQGTIDGTNWFDLRTYTGTTDAMEHIVNKPIRKVRGNIVTLDTGSVTVKSIHGSN